MCNTCVNAEGMVDYDALYMDVRKRVLKLWGAIPPEESVASSAVKTARDINASLVSSSYIT